MEPENTAPAQEREESGPAEFWVESMVSHRDRLPYVVVKMSTPAAQISTDKARFIAGMILEAAMAAETDAILYAWLQEAVGVDGSKAGQILLEFRRYRDQLAGRPEHGMGGIQPDICRVCGCTEDSACEGGCYWVEPGLCSSCAEKLKTHADQVPDDPEASGITIGVERRKGEP